MSKLFAVRAYENIYGGLHGMESLSVIEVETEEEAKEYAYDEALSVIDNYFEISENFEQEAEEEGLDPGSDEWCEFIEECRNEDVSWELFEITKETNESLDVLNEKFCYDPDTFIEEYCN